MKEFEREQKSGQQMAGIEAQSSKVEIAKLMRTVDMQTKEMNKVKKLAKTILDQVGLVLFLVKTFYLNLSTILGTGIDILSFWSERGDQRLAPIKLY